MYRILVVFCAFLFAACGGEPVDVREVDLEQVDPSGKQVTFWYQHTLKREELLKEMLAEYSRNN